MQQLLRFGLASAVFATVAAVTIVEAQNVTSLPGIESGTLNSLAPEDWEDRADERASKFKDKFKTFKKKFPNKVLKKRHDEAEAFLKIAPDHFEALEMVLSDDYWNIRDQAQLAIGRIKAGSSARQDVAKMLLEHKDENLQHHVIYALVTAPEMTLEDWQTLHALMQNDDLEYKARSTAAWGLSRWPLAQTPDQIPEGRSDEEKKKAEEQRTKLVTDAQPILKSNFQALFDSLSALQEDKKNIDRAKDPHQTWFHDQIVWSMERLTSQEHADGFREWQIWWRTAKEEATLEYRFDRRVMSEKAGTKSEERYIIREKRKVEADAELIILPHFGNSPELYSPFMDGFTQYFKRVSFFEFPAARELAARGEAERRRKQGQRYREAPNGGYYYPTEAVAREVFVARQKSRGVKAGMMTHGTSCFMAMWYAYEAPDQVPFIICVSPFADPSDEGTAVNQMKNGRKEIIQMYGTSRTYPDNQTMTEEQGFAAETGSIAQCFSDWQHAYQPWVFSKNMANRQKRQQQGLADGPTYIDRSASFEADAAKGKKVPALFIFGKDDPQYVKGTEKSLQRAFPNSQVVFVKDSARMPWIENPVEFRQVIMEFLKKQGVWKDLTGSKK